MALAAITSFVFDRSDYMRELWYYCETEEFLQRFPEYFIFRPPGFDPASVDLIIDVSKELSTKIRAMKAHQSQAADAEVILRCMEGLPPHEHFLVRKKA